MKNALIEMAQRSSERKPMTQSAITQQRSLLGMISRETTKAVMESYQAHRRNGASDFAAHHAALSVFLDHVQNKPLSAAAKAMRTIIVQGSTDLDQSARQGWANAIAA